MITRRGGYLVLHQGKTPAASEMIERSGYAVLRGAFDTREVADLHKEVGRVFERVPPDVRRDDKFVNWDEFRYEVLNRSPAAQRVVGDRRILDVVEPLLGEDCHVIANTAWRNAPRKKEDPRGGNWHVDAGPHVPHAADVRWDDRIPYPVFAIGVHILLQDCPESCGPTAVIPGSHKSGIAPPTGRAHDKELCWRGQGAVLLTGTAGDVVMFCSDVWHRRAPTSKGDAGRFFLQAHYGRRDLAQRLRPTAQAHQLSAPARGRAVTARERTVIGLHAPAFYDG